MKTVVRTRLSVGVCLLSALVAACGGRVDRQTQPVADSGPLPGASCLDNDGDGYPGTGECGALPASELDCNDNDPSIHPGAPEICNGIDDNCNGQIDEGDPGGGLTCTALAADGGQLLGACGKAVTHCEAGHIICPQLNFAAVEVCNGKDDDCDGRVDNVPGTTTPLSQSCYDGDAGTKGVGPCVGGTQTCAAGAWGLCAGEVTPRPEQCNGIDDDCDGRVDNVAGTANPLTESCYAGPAGTAGVGVCRAGTQTCASAAWGTCAGQVLPTSEVCNGVDDDCDGRVDNVAGTATPLAQSCYSGPTGTAGVGACQAGAQLCTGGTFGACTGQVLPASEVCNGIDDDCDGRVDNVAGTANPLSQSCYSGPAGTVGVGVCQAGTQTCSGGAFGACAGQVTPAAEVCNGKDDDCDGRVDNVAGTASPLTQSCYSGPAGTAGVGVCQAGTQTCAGGAYGACAGQVTPTAEVCNGRDDDCDGRIDNIAGTATPLSQSCYDGPSGTAGLGVCKSGTSTCSAGSWGGCVGEVVPQPPACDGLDNNCNGVIDEPFISATSDVDLTNQWSDIAFAPYYFSAGSCAGGANGSGTDALAGGALVGTTASALWFQRLDATGLPLGAAVQVEPYGYSVVGIAQAGDGFIVAGIWNGWEIDLAYVDASGNKRTDALVQFAGHGSNQLDSLRLVRANGRRVTFFWREYAAGSSPDTTATGIQTAIVEPAAGNGSICNAIADTNCTTPPCNCGATLTWRFWPSTAILAGLGADSDHQDWGPSQTCPPTSALRHMAVGYVYVPTTATGNCTANNPCVSYYDVMEDSSVPPPCGGSGACNPYPGTGMHSEVSPIAMTEPELVYYLPGTVNQWLTAWVTGYPSSTPVSSDLNFWMTSDQSWNWAYLANATDNGAASILHPRAGATANDLLLTAVRYVPDGSGFKRQMMSRHIDFSGNRVPGSQNVEISAMSGGCGPSQCVPGNKQGLAQWAAQRKIFYSATGGSPAGTFDSTLTCN